MKVFVLTSNPDRASFRQRVEAYLDILQANGIDCEVAKLPRGLLVHRRLFKQAADFDGVLLHKKKLNILDAFLLRRYAKRIIYNFDDAVMYSDKNPQRDSWFRYRPWQRSVEIADLVIAGSSYLAGLAQPFNSNVKVLPIGLKVSDYQVPPPARTDNEIRLVWIGSKSTLCYLAEISAALEQIGARFGNVVLRIICDDFLELQNVKVEKHRWFLENRAIDLAAGDIGLAPLPDNRFTRGKCSFKVLEYSSAGLPVVASPIGTNAEYVLDGVTGFFAAKIPEWVERTTKLIEDAGLRKTMGKQGRAQAKKFDLSVVGKQMVELIKGCLGGVEI